VKRLWVAGVLALLVHTGLFAFHLGKHGLRSKPEVNRSVVIDLQALSVKKNEPPQPAIPRKPWDPLAVRQPKPEPVAKPIQRPAPKPETKPRPKKQPPKKQMERPIPKPYPPAVVKKDIAPAAPQPIHSTVANTAPMETSAKQASAVPKVSTANTGEASALPPTSPAQTAAIPATLAVPMYECNPPPEYPVLARKRGYEGTVMVNVEVDATGRVKDLNLSASSGYKMLDTAALNAVKQWRFVPGKKGDAAVLIWVVVPVQFILSN
jgi:periplasmic protein TonB